MACNKASVRAQLRVAVVGRDACAAYKLAEKGGKALLISKAPLIEEPVPFSLFPFSALSLVDLSC